MDWRAVGELWSHSGGRITCAAGGFALGYFMMRFGVIWALIVGLLTMAGYLFGRRLDQRGETVGEFLDRVFPSGHDLSG